MIRIAKNDLRAKLDQFALFRCLNGTLRSNRHVNRCFNHSMIGFKDTRAGFAVLCNAFKFQMRPAIKNRRRESLRRSKKLFQILLIKYSQKMGGCQMLLRH